MWKRQDQAGSQPEYVERLKTIVYCIIEPNSFLMNLISMKVDTKCRINRSKLSPMRNMWKRT